jgi:aspartyl-tRNA(Asn)/glutamyl-tRNA(Gln) amidotransferase subunit C
MIDREEVLHVARLARLKLTDEEVERMAGELSSILGHIDTLTQLELDDVPPTSHVVEVERALRPDEPGPCLPREVALDQAPATQDGGFLVPSPQAV